MISVNHVLGEILSKFGSNIKGFSNNNVIYECPECASRGFSPDTKGHLYVKNSYPILFHCWRCDYRGVIKSNGDQYVSKEEPAPDDNELADLIENVLFKPKYEGISSFLEIPKLVPMPGTREYNYLLSRGLTDAMIKYYDIRLGLVGSKYSNRVIIPNIVFKGDSDYDYTDMFVARYIGNPPIGTEDFRKYLNPPGKNKSLTVFNLHRIKSNTPIIITEGVFTAMAAGPQAVATYGKIISTVQLGKILSKMPSKIYVNLDPDAYVESNDLCNQLYQYTNVPIYQVKFLREDGVHADAADIPSVKYKYYLSKAPKYDPVKSDILNQLGIDTQYLDSPNFK